ncbi:HGxxPAAW family protein [Sphaerisporangium perillae]|uniref:HGxxPAAW family protein n=1 Tax=Sphaerisporangium perillae TaxID=2935860 RepID=UPI00200D93BD|nr:HGxxPAAW family protein [Sphaerisporangium perillae]
MADSAPAQAHSGQSHAGRASSWLAVTVILVGFVIGGAALMIGPNWLLFWFGGGGVIAVGGILALVFDVFSDVIEDAPRTIAVQEHHSPFEHHGDRA